jgi:nucleoside-diphosphate-sugar epimerase
MKCLVTGGAGFIGSNLARRLVEAGESVRVLDNLSSGRLDNLSDVMSGIEVLKGDVRDPDVVQTAVKGVGCIFHLAAMPSVSRSVADPAGSNEVNVTGTLNLLVAARDEKVDRFVFSSSSSVYGDTPRLPKSEEMQPSPLSPYALQKYCAESYCRMFTRLYGLATYSLRYFNVFGPRQDPASQYAAVIPSFISRLRKAEAPIIYGDGDQTRDFTFVEDVVEANVRCCSAPVAAAGQVFNIAFGRRISINQLAVHLAGIAGREIEAVHMAARSGDIRDSHADISRARQELGWVPSVTLEDGLARTYKWFDGRP